MNGIRLAFAAVLFALAGLAAPPEHYYDAAAGMAGTNLLNALHAIIRDHHVIHYSSSAFDTGDALKVLDQAPGDTNFVTLVYGGTNQGVSAFGATTGWNREHLWPQSYGLDEIEPSYSDLFNLRACDTTVNSSRGNKYYDVSDPSSPNYKPDAHAEAPLCSTDTDSWEPRPSDRGDIARALFYMATRYNGDAVNEPALALTDDPSLIVSSNACMGSLSTLLAWHGTDPVDEAERLRNDRIYALYQFNRNPYVDHPEWVGLTFAPVHTNPPALAIAVASPGFVLSWLATNQVVHLEVSTNLNGGWTPVAGVPALNGSWFEVTWTNSAAKAFFRLRSP